MNERIREILKQATQYADSLGPIDGAECCDAEYSKFAELIVEEYAREYQKLVDGHSIVLPKNREHAENMVRVGMFYLENN